VKRDASSPEAYRADVSGEQRELLEAIRDLIFEVYPEVEEGIEYGMLDYPGLANLAAQKRYVSLYVAPAVLAEHAEAFAKSSRGKSCLRFERPGQLDPAALKRLLRDVRRFRQR
jgi:uncharacterized protein YdhG (YjbR/CyaY superfamily)